MWVELFRLVSGYKINSHKSLDLLILLCAEFSEQLSPFLSVQVGFQRSCSLRHKYY